MASEYVGKRAQIKVAVAQNLPLFLQSAAFKLGIGFEEFNATKGAIPRGFSRLFDQHMELITYQPSGEKAKVLDFEKVVANAIEYYNFKYKVVKGPIYSLESNNSRLLKQLAESAAKNDCELDSTEPMTVRNPGFKGFFAPRTTTFGFSLSGTLSAQTEFVQEINKLLLANKVNGMITARDGSFIKLEDGKKVEQELSDQIEM